MHERIVDQRRDFYRKEAWKPIDRYGYVSHEALCIWRVECMSKSDEKAI